MSTPASAIPRHEDTRRSVIDQASTDNKTGQDDVEDVEPVDENAGDVSCDADVENVEDKRSVAHEIEDTD